MFDVVLLGAGASGLVCAIQAARRGLSTVLLERNENPGKKILQTGNGRCNLSNLDMDASHFHGAKESFVTPALENFTVTEMEDFCESIGMPLTALPDGRVYPHSFQAKTVTQALLQAALDSGVQVVTESYCKHVEVADSGLTAVTFDNRTYTGRNFVLATGGSAMKRSGSDGNGYALAERLGHTVTERFPGIVALKLRGRTHQAMNGVKFPSKVTLLIDNQPIRSDEGDILFTDYGISGPPILQLSRHANAARLAGKMPVLGVSLLREEWTRTGRIEQFLMTRHEELERVLALILHDKIVLPFLKSIGVNRNAVYAKMAESDRRALIEALLCWRFEVIDSKPFDSAQVSCGGVLTDEIDENTMGSKLVPGLYMIGELLDVDGDCGGYNLHWAFAAASLCAKAL